MELGIDCIDWISTEEPTTLVSFFHIFSQYSASQYPPIAPSAPIHPIDVFERRTTRSIRIISFVALQDFLSGIEFNPRPLVS